MKDKQLTYLILIIIGIASFATFLYLNATGLNLDMVKIIKDKVPQKEPITQYNQQINLSSSAFKEGQMIPDKYTCKGQDISPPLSISNLPKNTKSLVLIVEDPDATYKTWTHWVMFNIDPNQQEIVANTAPPRKALLGVNDFGSDDYRGPCPPIGKHRYVFTIYALDKILDLEKGVKKDKLLENMQGHVIDTGVLTGIFEK